jgi:ApaG protein
VTSAMFVAETAGVIVRVAPEFIERESDPDESRYVWSYTIEIENRGPEPVQLMHRHWRITDGHGHTQEVQGPGVVGKQPLIAPGETFQYTSFCPLAAPSGVMVGSYDMLRPSDGARFSVAVPAFALDSPFETRRPS